MSDQTFVLVMTAVLLALVGAWVSSSLASSASTVLLININ